ncbi:MAG: magnesium chelatase [Planctomycetota bacterium JB042]
MNPIRTLGALRESGATPVSVRDELRTNLLARLERSDPLFPGVIGFDETVVPQIVNAILSRHDFILLGLRGQAKTRLLRSLTALLDEATPVVPGCPLNSHPLAPIGRFARRRVAEEGDDLEIGWIPREERYREKLATPDITIADLIGDVDPIKAATRRLDLDDEEVIHYGLVPRTNRGIFGLNELPDLPTRIQVGLLNILEEKDVQIRGFPIRLPVDVLLAFTANPEDYTNRGSIITPLRDRIESQIHTHYPLTLEEGIRITRQEAWLDRGDGAPPVTIPAWFEEIVEETAVQARTSSFVDQNSGVSARMTIALAENLVSNAERRAVRLGLERTTPRVSDLFAAIPAVSGKIELVYEGEREGPVAVARAILGRAVKAVFDRVLPDPYRDDGASSIYEPLVKWFRAGNRVEVSDESAPDAYVEELRRVKDLESLARNFFPLPREDDETRGATMELVLEGLHQASLLGKEDGLRGTRYSDAFDEMTRELEGDR